MGWVEPNCAPPPLGLELEKRPPTVISTTQFTAQTESTVEHNQNFELRRNIISTARQSFAKNKMEQNIETKDRTYTTKTEIDHGTWKL